MYLESHFPIVFQGIIEIVQRIKFDHPCILPFGENRAEETANQYALTDSVRMGNWSAYPLEESPDGLVKDRLVNR